VTSAASQMAKSPLITVRAIESDRQRLREAAAARRLTVSDLIRTALAAHAGVTIRAAR